MISKEELKNRIDNINQTTDSVSIAIAGTIYYPSKNSGNLSLRQSIWKFYEMFVENFGDDFDAFRLENTDYRWAPKNKQRQVTALRKRLNRPEQTVFYYFFFTRDSDNPTTYGIYCSSIPAYDISVCGFMLPITIWVEREKEIEQFFMNSCTELSADQAYLGLTVVDEPQYYFDGSADIDDKRIAAVKKLLRRYPMLDFNHTDMNGINVLHRNNELRAWGYARELGGYRKKTNSNVFELVLNPATVELKKKQVDVWGLRWPAQLNYLNNTWIKKLGGVSALKKAIDDRYITSIKKGKLVRAYDVAFWDNAELLRKIAAYTKKCRINIDENLTADWIMSERLMRADAATRWIKRFDE